MMITWALRYAAIGWPVFPLTPRGKAPLVRNPHRRGTPERDTCRGECGREGHGCLDATTDPDVITRWWTRTPSANIGIATGAPGPDVLDVDTKHGAPGAASWARLAGLPIVPRAIARVVTASGGWHLYYAGTVDQGNGRLPQEGLDFRATGGYVVAAPSVVGLDDGADGRYILDGPVDLTATGPLRWAEVRRFFRPEPPVPAVRRTPGPGAVDGAIAWLAKQPATQGNRNSALHWAACRLVELGAGEDDFAALAAAAAGLKLKDHEIRQTISSARRGAGRVYSG